jgi:hypothetical protein
MAAKIKAFISENPYMVIGVLTLLAYPYARSVMVKQTSIITVMVSTPLNIIFLFGIWGWYADKKWGESRRKFWTIMLAGDVVLVIIAKMIGCNSIFG